MNPEAGGTVNAGRPAWARSARVVAILAVLVLAVTVVMVQGKRQQPREEPWRSAALQAMRLRLEQDPKNEPLKDEIRKEDLRLRRAYFHGLERNRTGAWILLAAATALIWVAHRSRGPRRLVPSAPERLGREETARKARWATATVGGACLLAMAVVGGVAGGRPGLPVGVAARPEGAAKPAAEGTPSPAPVPVVETSGQWARFRGREGSGVVEREGLPERIPLSWDVASGKGVLWKTPVPLTGFNSPVVWKDRVFLTGGDKEKRLVFCFDAGQGSLLWSKPVVDGTAPPVEPPDQSGAAASTVATDGERVFAIFATGELGALDFDGKLLWSRKLDFTENGYGHASSLVVWRDRLLVQADQGTEEDGKSALVAYDVRTGQPAWTARRPVGGSWASPIVVDAGGKALVVTVGDPFLMAHEAGSGTEVWRARVLGGELAPSPIRAGNLIVAVSPGHALVAVKADGTGDVTATHVAWKLEKHVPDVPTPVVAGDLLFTANTEGHVFCRELATGAQVWEHAFELEFQASPILLGNRIYQLAQPGSVRVFEAAREFKELAAFDMGEELYATPAVAGGRMFIRGKKNLFAVGDGETKSTEVAHVR